MRSSATQSFALPLELRVRQPVERIAQSRMPQPARWGTGRRPQPIFLDAAHGAPRVVRSSIDGRAARNLTASAAAAAPLEAKDRRPRRRARWAVRGTTAGLLSLEEDRFHERSVCLQVVCAGGVVVRLKKIRCEIGRQLHIQAAHIVEGHRRTDSVREIAN
jgi:hypothetical protein